MILNYEKKFLEWLIVELLPVVRDQDSRDLVPVDDVPLDEASYIFLHEVARALTSTHLVK